MTEEAKAAFDRQRHQLRERCQRDHKLTPTARLVAAEIIAKARWSNNEAFPGEQWLADRIGVSARTVKRAIKDLRENYFIISKRGRLNVYRLNFAALDDQLPLPGIVSAQTPRKERSPDKDVGAIGDISAQAQPKTWDTDVPYSTVDRGQICPKTGDTTVPLSPLRDIPKSPAPTGAVSDAVASVPAKLPAIVSDRMMIEPIERASNVVALDDPKIRLWRDGTACLVSLGVKELTARNIIGRWLKDHGGDHKGVFAAICAARDQVPSGDVIAYVTQILKAKPGGKPARSGPAALVAYGQEAAVALAMEELYGS